MVSTPARHAAVQGSISARTRHVILGVKTLLSTLEIVFRILKAGIVPSNLVSMLGEVKDPTQGVNV